MQELWHDIDMFPPYSISNYGEVRNDKTGRILSQSTNQYSKPKVGLTIPGNPRPVTVGVVRLVAEHFLDPPEHEHFDTPIHLDGNPKNCRADNLMWRPRWYAIKYHQQFTSPNWFSHDVPCRNVDTGETFNHPSTAAQHYGVLSKDIFLSMFNGDPVPMLHQNFERL